MKKGTAGPPSFSDSRLRTIDTCLRQYYYTYHNKKRDVEVLNPDTFKGIFLHRMIEKCWVTQGPGKLRKRNISGRDSYIHSVEGYFKRYLSDGYIRKVKVGWENKEDKWKFLYKEAKEILSMYYHLSDAEGPPLAVEVPFKAKINNNEFFVGVIDEIRLKRNGFGLKIRDHKYYPGGLSEDHLKFDHQFTLYLLVLTCDLANYGPITREYLGLDLELAKKIAGDQILSQNIDLEYHMLSQGLKIIPVKRDLVSLEDFKSKFNLIKNKLSYAKATGNYFAERGTHCRYCPAKIRCDKDTLEGKVQSEIDFELESIKIDKYYMKKKKKQRNQKFIRFPKKELQIEIKV